MDSLYSYWQENYKKVYHFILRRVKVPEFAEDITNDTFIRSCDSYESFRGESNLETWIFTIALNNIKMCPRKQERENRKKQIAQSLDFMKYEDSCRQAEYALRLRETTDRMQNLPLSLRNLVKMRAEEMSYEEISVSAGMPLNTVKSSIHRARQYLKEADTGND